MQSVFRLIGYGLCGIAAIAFLGCYAGIVLAAIGIDLLQASVKILLGALPMQVLAIVALWNVPIGRNVGEQMTAVIKFAPVWFRILYWSAPVIGLVGVGIGSGFGNATWVAILSCVGACWFYGFHAMTFWAAAKGIEPVYSCPGGHMIEHGWTYCRLCGRRRDEETARM